MLQTVAEYIAQILRNVGHFLHIAKQEFPQILVV